jgi:non-ribosomal peptide synthase protein (TIGR01720 family)
VILKSKEKCPQIQLDIEYGPTESSVAATVFRDIKPGLEGRIGKPIANTKLFILDQNNSLLPIGIPGELCISGVGLAQGYLNKELLTKEKFIDNPFYKEDTETSSYQRMYRTGDLVKWLKDGNIQFLGRIDNQVKIRSFRIELGEIENQLLSHEKIKAAIVIAKENENSDKYLCAYYVAKEQISGSQLRDFLRSILPDYMVPAYFIQLEQMPVTANGKVDRKALPEPKDQLIIEANYVAPRNRIEEKMAMVWQEVLGISQIGMDDNFFALGGDSIKAIQIAAKLKNEQLKLNVQDLFRYKNIGTLSSYVEEDTIAVCQGEVCGEVLLAPVQRWFFQNTFAEMNHFNQSVILFKKERFDAEITERTLKKLVIHHDALRMTFNRDGEQIRQYNRDTAGTLYTFKVFNFTKDQDFVLHAEDEMNRLQRSMNLETGPLLGAALFQTHEGDHLFIVVHHLVIDGVSWRILFQDFSDCYDAFYAGNEPQLMNKSNSYMEWTKSLNEYANSAELLAEIEYWQQLEQLDVPLLPKDMQANSNKMIDSSDFSIQLSKEYTRLLMNQVNLAYHTEINDILLTALGITIRDFTGAELIKIDMEGHGRENIIEGIDINRTVGWFTSTYPVALHMGAAQLLSVQIKDVKETVRKIKNKGIGYGILKYMTAKENLGSLRFNRQPEISFNYLGQFDEDITNKVFTVESALKSEDMSLLYTRTHTLEFSGMVSGGCLSMTVNYNKKEFKTVTIENLMNNLKQNIIAIILHCVEKDNAEITPSDVSREEITPAEFEEITAMLDDL